MFSSDNRDGETITNIIDRTKNWTDPAEGRERNGYVNKFPRQQIFRCFSSHFGLSIAFMKSLRRVNPGVFDDRRIMKSADFVEKHFLNVAAAERVVMGAIVFPYRDAASAVFACSKLLLLECNIFLLQGQRMICV